MDLHLLGTPLLAGSRLEPARAALLAYLALEGEASRARLTQLLWPHKPPKTARNNLRKHLSRLRQGYPEACVLGDPLRLAGELSVDVLLLRSACERKDYRSAIQYTGDLLGDLEYDALAPEDDEDGGGERHEALLGWLSHARREVRQLQVRAHLHEIERLEQERNLPEALDLARRLCSMDDEMEEAWRAAMRLHFLMGERSAALACYRQCRDILRGRLNVPPSEETQQLARDIERQEVSANLPPQPRRPPVPLSVLRPRLVGREQEWARMEAAWEARKPTFVYGELGVGKSRLMTEFAASRGRWIQLEARPGDRDIPYATHVRSVQKLMEQRRKDGRPPVPAWVEEQLGPLIPALGPGGPRRSPKDKLRFFHAAAELFCDSCRDLDAVVFDDLQYIDPESFELGMYARHQLEVRAGEVPEGGKPYPLIISGYRESRVEPRWLDLMRDLVSQGLAVPVEVRPLAAPDVRALLQGMELGPGLQARASQLAREMGGNPLYIVEAVVDLVGSGLPR